MGVRSELRSEVRLDMSVRRAIGAPSMDPIPFGPSAIVVVF